MYVVFLSVSHVLKEKTLVLFPAPWAKLRPRNPTCQAPRGLGFMELRLLLVPFTGIYYYGPGSKNPQSNTHGLQQN